MGCGQSSEVLTTEKQNQLTTEKQNQLEKLKNFASEHIRLLLSYIYLQTSEIYQLDAQIEAIPVCTKRYLEEQNIYEDFLNFAQNNQYITGNFSYSDLLIELIIVLIRMRQIATKRGEEVLAAGATFQLQDSSYLLASISDNSKTDKLSYMAPQFFREKAIFLLSRIKQFDDQKNYPQVTFISSIVFAVTHKLLTEQAYAIIVKYFNAIDPAAAEFQAIQLSPGQQRKLQNALSHMEIPITDIFKKMRQAYLPVHSDKENGYADIHFQTIIEEIGQSIQIFPLSKAAEEHLSIWLKGLTDIAGRIHVCQSMATSSDEEVLVHLLMHELGHKVRLIALRQHKHLSTEQQYYNPLHFTPPSLAREAGMAFHASFLGSRQHAEKFENLKLQDSKISSGGRALTKQTEILQRVNILFENAENELKSENHTNLKEDYRLLQRQVLEEIQNSRGYTYTTMFLVDEIKEDQSKIGCFNEYIF